MNLTEIEKSNINIIPATTIDGRKNNWIIGLIGDTNIAYVKICSKKQDRNQNNRLKYIYFDNTTTSKGKLHLKKCTKIKCNIRMQNGNTCLLELEKKRTLLIKGRTKKINVDEYIINQ